MDELRRLLVENRRNARQERLNRYRRTGRVVSLSPDLENPSLSSLRAGAIPDEDGTPAPKTRSRIRRFMDSALLLVEVGAVIGFIFLVYSLFGVLRSSNQEFAEAQKLPTLTPTPLIMAVVLPSGHTPPDSPGGARPNEAEIPEHLRPLVQCIGQYMWPWFFLSESAGNILKAWHDSKATAPPFEGPGVILRSLNLSVPHGIANLFGPLLISNWRRTP